MLWFTIYDQDRNTNRVEVSCPREGFDWADRLGAKSLRDQYGSLHVKIEGEWYGVPEDVSRRIKRS